MLHSSFIFVRKFKVLRKSFSKTVPEPLIWKINQSQKNNFKHQNKHIQRNTNRGLYI